MLVIMVGRNTQRRVATSWDAIRAKALTLA